MADIADGITCNPSVEKVEETNPLSPEEFRTIEKGMLLTQI